jgi:hypothetical protein
MQNPALPQTQVPALPQGLPLLMYGRPVTVTTAAGKATAIEQIQFLDSTLPDDQVRLCRERMTECMQMIIAEAKIKQWKIAVHNNYIILPRIRKSGDHQWARIGLLIGPDSYKMCYMETALLAPFTREFINDHGYTNHETKRHLSFGDLADEIDRLLEISKKLEVAVLENPGD